MTDCYKAQIPMCVPSHLVHIRNFQQATVERLNGWVQVASSGSHGTVSSCCCVSDAELREPAEMVRNRERSWHSCTSICDVHTCTTTQRQQTASLHEFEFAGTVRNGTRLVPAVCRGKLEILRRSPPLLEQTRGVCTHIGLVWFG